MSEVHYVLILADIRAASGSAFHIQTPRPALAPAPAKDHQTNPAGISWHRASAGKPATDGGDSGNPKSGTVACSAFSERRGGSVNGCRGARLGRIFGFARLPPPAGLGTTMIGFRPSPDEHRTGALVGGEGATTTREAGEGNIVLNFRINVERIN
jgi:hypothetical protein